ncbi:site-specific integrase [Geomonas limicola]|nr:site-specific integrase [Geomonas limicola]
MITWEELRKVLDTQLDQLLRQEREKLRAKGPYPMAADDVWKRNVIPNYRKAIHDISFCGDSAYSGKIPEFARNLAEGILQGTGIELDRSSEMFVRFCEGTVRMYLEFTKQRQVLNDEARSFRSGIQSVATYLPPVAVDGSRGLLLSEVVEKYCNEMVAGNNWQPKTESEMRAIYRVLLGIIHNMPIAQVDHAASSLFKETLLKLPSNMTKKPLYRDKPIQGVVKMQIPKEDRLSIAKVNAYLSRVSSLFHWAIKNGHTTTNPFHGLKIKEKVADYEKRDPFALADLQALFSTPEYQTQKPKHPYQYWLPLMGLFTGARIEELCQLHLDDIRHEGELWVIDINAKGDKKLKTLSSCRVIPMHPRLVDFGLLEYAKSLRKKGHIRLFPELKKRRDGYSQDASRWFTRYRMRCGVTGERKTFHSFRHTVINHLKQRGEVKEKIAAICGHKDESITTGLYGKPYEPAALVSVIEALDFKVAVTTWKV